MQAVVHALYRFVDSCHLDSNACFDLKIVKPYFDVHIMIKSMLLSWLLNRLWHLAALLYSQVGPVFNKIKISMLVFAFSCVFNKEVLLYVW